MLPRSDKALRPILEKTQKEVSEMMVRILGFLAKRL